MDLSAGCANGVSWVHESPFLNVDYELRNPFGAPSLKHLATKKILSDQRNLHSSHFANIPWAIARALWKYLQNSGKRTMYMWKILCASYPTEFRQTSPYCKKIVDNPRLSMRDYLSLVKDDACSWATILSLWTEYALIPELVEIAQIHNIIALEINSPLRSAALDESRSQDVATLNDRILRTWSELAQTSGALKHLRVLKLYGQKDLSGITFQYISAFPSLEMCVVARSDGLTSLTATRVALEYGWSARQERERADIFNFSKPHGSQRTHEPSVKWEDHNDSWQLVPPTLPEDIPLLEFTVGQRWEWPRNDFDIVFFYRERKDRMAMTNAGIKRRRRDTTTCGMGDNGTVPKKAKQPSIKNSRQKDLTGLLAEFSGSFPS